MILSSIIKIIFWVIAALICALVARKKGKNEPLAWIMGALLGVFAMLYYLFCKSEKKRWEKKHSWYILMGYILLAVIVSAIEFFLGV